jgi:C1A family cysteine protease
MGQTCSGQPVAADDVILVQQASLSTPVRTTKKLGWKKDLPDFRDRVLDLPVERKANLPEQVDLRPKEHFPIYDQGNLGSCTANAIGAAFHFDQVQQGLTDFTPSRLFIYYNERAMEGSIAYDNGAYIRDGIKSINKIGVCNETAWPYDISTFTDKPGDACYAEAAKNTAAEYARVPQTLEDIKACLNEGFPIVFGFTVLSSFFDEEVSKTGRMPMPQSEDQILGGHAVQACGYNDEEKVIIVRNSWGEEWGDEGYFYMPYDYICDPFLASDMWAVKFVTGGGGEGRDFPTRRP